VTRDEHLAWCKERALEYLDRGELASAVASMGSDMTKHPETRMNEGMTVLGMMYVMQADRQGLRRWIEGFR
jgi:hypothetical protein